MPPASWYGKVSERRADLGRQARWTKVGSETGEAHGQANELALAALDALVELERSRAERHKPGLDDELVVEKRGREIVGAAVADSETAAPLATQPPLPST